MRYRLRTLLLAVALGPPVLAGCWFISRAVATQRSSTEAIFIFGISGSIVVAAAVVVMGLMRLWRQDID